MSGNSNVAKTESSQAVRWAMVVVAVLMLGVFSSFIFAAAMAGASLLFLGVIGTLGVAAIQALPWLGQKWENWLLKKRKEEAAANPIEQLQNFLMERKQRVELAKQRVVEMGTVIRSLESAVEEQLRKNPRYNPEKQRQAIQAMKSMHAEMTTRYKAAQEACKQLEQTIEDKKFEWEFSKAGQSALASMGNMSGEDLMNELLADEAMSSVRDNFNKVFAELEISDRHINDSQLMVTYDLPNGVELLPSMAKEKV